MTARGQTAARSGARVAGGIRLRAVLSEVDVLLRMTDVDALLRHAVEFMRTGLGVERCGLFLQDAEDDRLRGTFGTDGQGQTRDERSLRISKDSTWPRLVQLAAPGRTAHWLVDTFPREPINHDAGTSVWRDWRAATPLVTSGGKLAGILFNDTALTHKPPDEEQQELLAVFCSLLANAVDHVSKYAAFRGSEERLRSALDSSHTGGWDLNLIDHTAFRTLEHDRLFGYSELLPQWTYETFLEHVLPEDRALVDRQFREAVEARHDWNFECRIVRCDKSVRWIWACGRPYVDESGTARYLSGIVQDITERKANEEALRRTHETLSVTARRARAILDEANRLLAIADRDELLRHAVEFVRRELGIDRCGIFVVDEKTDALTGTFGTDDRGQTTDERALRMDKGLGVWTTMLDRIHTGQSGWFVCDGTYVYYNDGPRTMPGTGWVVATPISVAGNRLTGVMFNDSAISRAPLNETQQDQLAMFCSLLGNLLERRRLEIKMQQVQKLESLGVLAGGIAHDFNNLLTAILGNADLALVEMAPETPGRECMEEIVDVSRKAADLCRNMLAYSGKGRFVVEPLDLSRLVQEMAHMLEISVSKKAALHYNMAENLPPVRADATQLRQVVMNLIINAAEAIARPDGAISISTGVVDCDRAYLADACLGQDLPAGRYVQLEVADSGCGMDAATLARIFDPFFTTKFAGRGLGLAAVQGIVRGHHGTIEVHSAPGQGTTFTVLLPVCDERTAETRRPPPGESGRQKPTGTILVVDDEADVRAIASRMLKQGGFSVLAAADGKEGVELFRQHKTAIAGVLLDLTMPCCDGEETFRLLRAMDPAVRVVITSGYNEQDVTQRFVGKGLAGFIQKPFQLEELLATMRGAVRSA